MIDIGFDDRKKFLNKELYVESDTEFELEEQRQEGKAKIKCILDGYSIAFKKADENKFPYIDHKKCADAIVLKKIDEDKWELKILEFKKTITINSWKKSKEQFKGAILNSLALSGLLGIKDFENIEVYSAFRDEKLSLKEIKNPILLKQPVGEKPKQNIDDWKNGYVYIDFIPEKLKHHRIHLDNYGNGEITL